MGFCPMLHAADTLAELVGRYQHYKVPEKSDCSGQDERAL